MYSIGNIVNNIVVTLYGDSWSPALSWWLFFKLLKHQIIMFYIWN